MIDNMAKVIIAIDPALFAVIVFMAVIFMVSNMVAKHPTRFDRATLIIVFSLTLFFMMLKVMLWTG